MNGEDNALINAQIKQYDSLKTYLKKAFNKKHFDYIIGNPPYVNTHDMSRDVSNFLKEKFITTQNGVFNIFYAFIEHAMQFISNNGRLVYIVPNNFLVKQVEKEAESMGIPVTEDINDVGDKQKIKRYVFGKNKKQRTIKKIKN